MSQNLMDGRTPAAAPPANGVDVRGLAGAMGPGERVVGAASGVVVVSLLLNWVSVSCSGALCGFGETGGANGLHSWGLLTLVGLLGAVGLLAARTVLAGRVEIPALPASDAVLYMAMGAVEVAGALLFWLEYHSNFVSDGPISIGLGIGWPVALAAGIATIGGGRLAATGRDS